MLRHFSISKMIEELRSAKSTEHILRATLTAQVLGESLELYILSLTS